MRILHASVSSLLVVTAACAAASAPALVVDDRIFSAADFGAVDDDATVAMGLPFSTLSTAARPSGTAHVVCAVNNDLYTLLTPPKQRHSDVSSAIMAAAAGEPLLVLAEGYPETLMPITAEQYAAAHRKSLNIFIDRQARSSTRRTRTSELRR